MKKKHIYLTFSIIIGSGALLYALLYTPPSGGDSNQIISQIMLNEKTGVDGNECWVAIDGTVYSISGFSQWQMGRHTPSEGKATCGRDLSGVISESPHGKSILSLLRVVGQLE